MKNSILQLVVAAGSLAIVACAPAPRPAALAANVERLQCDQKAASRDDLVRSTRVLSVEPLYSHVKSNANAEERVNGAKLVVRPPSGVTAEELTRVLQCHSARVLLGQLSPSDVAHDPYWLPDTWVNIDVRPENGNFAITLSADSVRENLQLFGRANKFADDHMVAADPGLP